MISYGETMCNADAHAALNYETKELANPVGGDTCQFAFGVSRYMEILLLSVNVICCTGLKSLLLEASTTYNDFD